MPSTDLSRRPPRSVEKGTTGPVAARAAENDIEVTSSLASTLKRIRSPEWEHAVRIDFHARTVLHPFQDAVTETQRDSRTAWVRYQQGMEGGGCRLLNG